MKTIFLFTLFLVTGFFYSTDVNAQAGWQWAITGAHSSGEAWPVATDNEGNVYASGYGATMLGTDTLWGGMFVTKADSNGNYVWSKGTKNATVAHVGLAVDTAGNAYALGVYTSYASPMFVDTDSVFRYNGAQEYFLMKINAAGNVKWIRNVTANNGGPTYYYGGIGIDGAGNVYVSGVFSVPRDTLGSYFFQNKSDSNYFDAFVAKFDTSGDVVWAKSFGGRKDEFNYSLTVSKGGDVYISGVYGSDTMAISGVNLVNPLYETSDMCYMAKFDNSGNLTWAKNLSRHIEIDGMKVDPAGNICATGYVDSFCVLANDTLTCGGIKDVFLAKYDPTGNAIWATSAGGIYTDRGWNLDVDTCGNIWVAGVIGGTALGPGIPYTMNFQGHSLTVPARDVDPMFIAEFNNSGHYLMGRTLGGGGDDQNGIAVDNRGNVYVCGDYEDSAMVVGNDTLPVGTVGGGNPEFFFLAKYKYSSGGCDAPLDTGNSVKQLVASASEIVIYPNPALYEFTILTNTPFTSGSRSELYDLTGRLVKSNDLSGNRSVISVAGLSPGVYQCRIITGDKKVVVKKVVVMK